MIRQPEFFQTMGIAESKRNHKVHIIRKIIMDINEKAIELHKLWKGKLETTSKVHIMSKEDLSILYTPGVAAPLAIADLVKEDELNEENILPDALNAELANVVAQAVKRYIWVIDKKREKV